MRIYKDNLVKNLTTNSFLLGTALCAFSFTLAPDNALPLAASAFWLSFVACVMRDQVLPNFESFTSRLLFIWPVFIAVVPTVRTLLYGHDIVAQTGAAVSIIAWTYMLGIYRLHFRNYEDHGRGPQKQGILMSPSEDDAKHGDLLLVGGDIARQFGDGFDHAEVVLVMEDGSKWTASCFIEVGAKYTPLAETLTRIHRQKQASALFRRKNMTPEEAARLWPVSEQMIAENRKYRDQVNAEIDSLIERRLFWMSDKWKQALRKHLYFTGYSWKARYVGYLKSPYPAWTCISFCIELYHRCLMATLNYGLGIWGLGTGNLDSIMPGRSQCDPNLAAVLRPGFAPLPYIDPITGTTFKEKLVAGLFGWPAQMWIFARSLGFTFVRLLKMVAPAP